MDLAESDSHGATARISAPTPAAQRTLAPPRDAPHGDAPHGHAPSEAAQAAATYLDLWEANQAEIARLGPPQRRRPARAA